MNLEKEQISEKKSKKPKKILWKFFQQTFFFFVDKVGPLFASVEFFFL